MPDNSEPSRDTVEAVDQLLHTLIGKPAMSPTTPAGQRHLSHVIVPELLVCILSPAYAKAMRRLAAHWVTKCPRSLDDELLLIHKRLDPLAAQMGRLEEDLERHAHRMERATGQSAYNDARRSYEHYQAAKVELQAEIDVESAVLAAEVKRQKTLDCPAKQWLERSASLFQAAWAAREAVLDEFGE